MCVCVLYRVTARTALLKKKKGLMIMMMGIIGTYENKKTRITKGNKKRGTNVFSFTVVVI